jgi:hypothetical protein
LVLLIGSIKSTSSALGSFFLGLIVRYDSSF